MEEYELKLKEYENIIKEKNKELSELQIKISKITNKKIEFTDSLDIAAYKIQKKCKRFLQKKKYIQNSKHNFFKS
jgi:hypothetical protein